MRLSQNIVLALIVTFSAAGFFFWKQSEARADGAPTSVGLVSEQADAIFAGGCFWCVESDFDKVDGVLATISGYTGGHLDNPSYKQVVRETTGHYEAVRVVYDPAVVSYSELVDYFWRHVDPTDGGGQFCDRGDSYRPAVFVETEDERQIVNASIAAIDMSGVLPDPIAAKVVDRSTFWPAEEYHQDYYEKNPLRYKAYRWNCGRDARVKQVWGR